MNLNRLIRNHIQNNIDIESTFLANGYNRLSELYFVRHHISVPAENAFEYFTDINQEIRMLEQNITLYERTIPLMESILDNNPIQADYEAWDWFRLSIRMSNDSDINSPEAQIWMEMINRFPVESDSVVLNAINEGPTHELSDAIDIGSYVDESDYSQDSINNVQEQTDCTPIQTENNRDLTGRPYNDDTVYEGVSDLFVEDADNDIYDGLTNMFESPEQDSTYVESERSRFYNDELYEGISEMYNPSSLQELAYDRASAESNNISTTEPSNSTQSSTHQFNSLIDEYADVSTEHMDFLGGDD